MRTTTPTFQTKLERLLRKRRVPAVSIARVYQKIARAIAMYREDLNEGRKANFLFDPHQIRWLNETRRLADQLRDRLLDTRYSPHDPDHVPFPSSLIGGVPLGLIQQLNALSRDIGPPAPRRRGKPVDVAMGMLDLGVGSALLDAGIKITTAKTGTFARVVDLVREEVGVTRTSEKAVRRACALLKQESTSPKMAIENRI